MLKLTYEPLATVVKIAPDGACANADAAVAAMSDPNNIGAKCPRLNLTFMVVSLGFAAPKTAFPNYGRNKHMQNSSYPKIVGAVKKPDIHSTSSAYPLHFSRYHHRCAVDRCFISPAINLDP